MFALFPSLADSQIAPPCVIMKEAAAADVGFRKIEPPLFQSALRYLKSQRLKMTGKLSQHPLTELIREIVLEGLSGSLRLEHERVKTAIYFEQGELVYATSNLRAHRLAESLRRWRVITEQQFASLSKEGRTDAEVGRTLVAQGILMEESVNVVRARQVADVLRPALLWTDGVWNFDARVLLIEDVRVTVELTELLMEAARRLPKNKTAERFPNTNEKVQPSKEVPNRLDLLPEEAFVLSRIDAPMRLHELLAISGLPTEETLHACYALSIGGFLEREWWARAFSSDDVKRALTIAAAAQNAPRAPEATKVEEPKPQPKVADEALELEELFERVAHATTHYQVLGLARSADQDTIKNAYHRLARRFHPDRFHQDAELRGRVESVFTKIAQAYEVLRDKSQRATYDLKLEREKAAAPPQAPTQASTRNEPPTTQPISQPSSTTTAHSAARRGEESFQSGLSALKEGKAAQALSLFAEAARLEPKVARYRAQYGQALAQSEQMRHRAEAEIQAAIMLEPTNISYRIVLAKLYQSLGFIKRAQGELERALALDPGHAEAQELLAGLQLKQGAR